jgi:hypothetical protein
MGVCDHADLSGLLGIVLTGTDRAMARGCSAARHSAAVGTSKYRYRLPIRSGGRSDRPTETPPAPRGVGDGRERLGRGVVPKGGFKVA